MRGSKDATDCEILQWISKHVETTSSALHYFHGKGINYNFDFRYVTRNREG